MKSRELIESTLFGLFTGLPGFVTISRKYKHWTEVPPAEQPALFLRQVGQRAIQEKGVPTKWEFSYMLGVYANSNNPEDIPSTIQNELLDQVEKALAPDDIMTHSLTLGRLVSHCWIEGEINTDEGLLGQQTVAEIPIKILVNI